MSEIQGVKPPPIEQNKISQKEQGNKSAEASDVPEKELSFPRKMSLVLNSVLSAADIRPKSSIADKLIHDSAVDQGEVKKGEYRFNVHGNKDVVKLLRGELPQEQIENATLGIEVDSGAQGGVVSTAMMLELYDCGIFQKVKEVQLYCTSVGDVVGAYIAADKGVFKDGIRQSDTSEKAAELFWMKNCETEVDDRGITRGKFVRLPKSDGQVAQLKALMEAGPKSEKVIDEKSESQKRSDAEKFRELVRLKPNTDEQIMDTDWAIDNVEKGKNSLDVEALANSKIKVNVFLMNAESGEGKWFNLNEAAKVGPERVFKIMHAGCMPPGAAGEPIEIDGQLWADGAYAKGGKKFKEMNESCTHRLRLKNFPEGKRPPSIVNKIVGLIAEHRYKNYSEKVGHLIRSQNVVKEHEDALLDEEITSGEMTAVVQIPKDGKGVDSLSIDSEEIYGMYKEVRKYMKDLLDPTKSLPDRPDAPKPAGEELKAMDTSGKTVAETKPEGAVKPVAESSGNASTGAKRVEEVKDKTPAEEREAESKSLKNKASSVVERVLGSGKENTYYEWELVKAEVKRRVEADEGLADVIKDMKIEIDGKKPGNLSSNKRFLKAEACIKLGVPTEDALDEFTAGGRRVQLGRREKEMWSKDHEYTDKMKEGAKNGRSRIEVFEELKLNDIDNMKIVDFLDLWKVRKSANPVELVKMIEQKGSRDFVLEHLKMNEKQGLEKTITEIGSLAQRQYLDVYAMFSASVEGGRAHFDKIKDGDSLRYKMREAAGVAWDKLKDFWKGGGGGGTDLDPTWPTNF